jgi:hypothetical protein
MDSTEMVILQATAVQSENSLNALVALYFCTY